MRASLESHGKLAAKDNAHINVSQPFTVFTYHINHIRDPNAHQFIQPTSSRTARSAWESPLNLVKVYDGGIRKSTVVTLCHPGGLSINCKKKAWYESWLMAT
jgi:hypothetical protein